MKISSNNDGSNTSKIMLDQLFGNGIPTKSENIVNMLKCIDTMSFGENQNGLLFFYDTESVYFNMYDSFNAFLEQSDKDKSNSNIVSGASKASASLTNQTSSDDKYSGRVSNVKLLKSGIIARMSQTSPDDRSIKLNSHDFFLPNENFTYASTTDNNPFINYVEYNNFSSCLNYQTVNVDSGIPIVSKRLSNGRISQSDASAPLLDDSQSNIMLVPQCSLCCPCSNRILSCCHHNPLNEDFISSGDYSLDDPAFYYRKYFYNQDHNNYILLDQVYGPIIISFMKNVQLTPKNISAPLFDFLSKDKKSHSIQFCRIIIRTVSNIELRATVAIPFSASVSDSPTYLFYSVLSSCAPSLKTSKFYKVYDNKKIQDSLLDLDEMVVQRKHKIGVLLCLKGQSSDSQMYSNVDTTSDFEKFLNLIADKVGLGKFDGFAGGLGVGPSSTKQHSYYKKFREHEIMFHVSTLLPHDPLDPQNVYIKRHIGNDKVVIVFQDDCDTPFDVAQFRSKFQHLFIVVRPNKSDMNDLYYDICVCTSKDVPSHRIFVPNYSLRPTKEFSNFFLNLLLTANEVVDQCKKLSSMHERTRHETMTNIINNLIKKSSSIKKPTNINRTSLQLAEQSVDIFDELINNELPGGVSILVNIHALNGELAPFNVVICSKSILFLPIDNVKTEFHIPNCRVHGWEVIENSLIRLYIGYIYFIDFSMSFSVDKNLLTVLKLLSCCTRSAMIKTIIWGDDKPQLSSLLTIGSNGTIESVNTSYLKKYPFLDCVGDSLFDINGNTKLPFSSVLATELISSATITSFKILPNKYSDKLNPTCHPYLSNLLRCKSLNSFLKAICF